MTGEDPHNKNAETTVADRDSMTMGWIDVWDDTGSEPESIARSLDALVGLNTKLCGIKLIVDISYVIFDTETVSFHIETSHSL